MGKTHWAIAVALGTGLSRYLMLVAIVQAPFNPNLFMNMLIGFVIGLLAWPLTRSLAKKFPDLLVAFSLLCGLLGSGYVLAWTLLSGRAITISMVLLDMLLWAIVGLCGGMLAWLVRPAADR